MRNLDPPDRDDARAHLVTALEPSVRKGVAYGFAATDADLDAILALYDAYDAALGAPEDAFKGAAFDVALRNAVKRGFSFTYEGGKLFHIRQALREGVEQCPVCGISAPNELDHYLPQGEFKLLAIYVRNLVPHCHECNNQKLAHVGAEDHERFVHAYFDELPDVQFMRANVELINNGLSVVFEVDDVEGLDDDLKARLENQIEHLALNDRYRVEINPFLTSQVTGLHMASQANGVAGVAEYLNRQAAVERRQFHRNHWRPVLLAALAQHAEFCANFADIFPESEEVDED